MNTANKLTLLRVVMIPAFLLVLYLDIPGANYWALVIFALASITDTLDGYIARHYNQVSNFGKFLDPLADKLLVISCMVIFIQWGRMPAWAVMIVLAREFAVTGLRLVAVENGRVIAAAWLGKIKTACTMVGLCVMLVLTKWAWLDNVVTAVIVLTTLVSGIEYFVKNWDVLDMKS